MKTITTVKKMQKTADKLRRKGKCIALVPTMGALHEGHLSLIRLARKKADRVVVSIFVNPTQFGPGEDLEAYPRDYSRDEKLAKEAGADIIFTPSVKEMYPDPFMTWVSVEKLTESLCGASRPAHFRGVATVCTKLFIAVLPHLAVFGEKDYQQLLVIKRLVRDLNFNITIIAGPIVREADGLAMSSRNVYLSTEERKDALALSESLALAKILIGKGERSTAVLKDAVESHIGSKTHTRIDYISIVDAVTLEPVEWVGKKSLIALAVYVGKTRLIDNSIVGLPEV